MGSEAPQRGPDPREPHVGVTDVTSLPGNMTVTTEAVTAALEEASVAGPHSFIHSFSQQGHVEVCSVPDPGLRAGGEQGTTLVLPLQNPTGQRGTEVGIASYKAA